MQIYDLNKHIPIIDAVESLNINTHKNKGFKIIIGIRQKMVLLLVIVLIIAFSISSYFTLQQHEEEITEETKRRGQDISRYLSEAIALHVVSYDYQSIQIMIDEVIRNSDIAYTAVTSRKGNIMASSGSANGNTDDNLQFVQKIQFDSKEIGTLLLTLNNKDIIARLDKKQSELIIREIIIIIVIAIGQFIGLSLYIAAPVTKFSDSLENNLDEDGRLTRNIEIHSKDEFGKLATLFNDLRQQLNQAHEKLENKIEIADKQLVEYNQKLIVQSEQLQTINKELEEIAITDTLTGLFNRRHFEKMLDEELEVYTRNNLALSLIIMDIDHFKNINDTYGHHNGDIVLQLSSGTFLQSVRSTDILCRIGGEEFIIICRSTDKKGAIELAEKIRKKIEIADICLDDTKQRITVSLGITTLNPNQTDINADTLFCEADNALYHSKGHGRNQVTHIDSIS